MAFIDEIKLHIEAGNGGNGVVRLKNGPTYYKV
jgi:GTPase involved in cell partitioning and DNA repair